MENAIRINRIFNLSFTIILIALAMTVGGLETEAAGVFESGLALSNKEQVVVKGLDLVRYMGRWYEIAKYPSFFEPSGGENTRATYSLRADGSGVEVLNETFMKGKKVSIKGFAYKADPKSDEAKLKVKFYNIPFVVGDYWVLYVDEDYQYAIVGHPFRISLFILSRKNKIDEGVYNQLVQKAVDQGYDVRKLQKTPQTDPPPSYVLSFSHM